MMDTELPANTSGISQVNKHTTLTVQQASDPASVADLSALFAQYLAFHARGIRIAPRDWRRRDQVVDDVAFGHAVGFVAYADNDPVGIVGVSASGEIEYGFVLPNRRGEGISRALSAAAIDAGGWYFCVDAKNTAMARRVERAGCACIGRYHGTTTYTVPGYRQPSGDAPNASHM